MEQEKIKEVIAELLRRMSLRFDDVLLKEVSESKRPHFAIKSEDSALLIGARGEHLAALNHIARKIACKVLGTETRAFFIDVNGYHEKNLETLYAKAKVMSERARSFKADIEMEPMSSYERMLIHSYLESEPDLKTESRGDGASRRVVIRYVAS